MLNERILTFLFYVSFAFNVIESIWIIFFRNILIVNQLW